MKGDVATATDGWIKGHEEIGVIDEVGSIVTNLKNGDHVLVSGRVYFHDAYK